MKTEAKVVISLALLLFSAEVAIRSFEARLSADLRHIAEFSKFAEEIHQARSQGHSAVVIVGNSLARAGIDAEVLRLGLIEKGWPNPKLFLLAPDATGVNEWTWSYRRYLSDSKPDLVLIATGPTHLLDQPVRSSGKLGAFHAQVSDWPKIFREDLTSLADRIPFVLAAVSRLMADRDRVQPLLFYRMIPGYESTARHLNGGGGSYLDSSSETAKGSAERFRFLLESIAPSSSEVLIVAIPLPRTYSLPLSVVEVAREQGTQLIDSGGLQSWTDSNFPDGYHLSEASAARFTEQWVKDLPSFRRSEDAKQRD